MSLTETLMRNRAETYNGWTKTFDNNNKIPLRTIKLGNVRNCNNDGIIKNFKVKNNILEVLTKYDINDYNINETDNEHECSYELQLKEEIYKSLIDKIIMKNHVK